MRRLFVFLRDRLAVASRAIWVGTVASAATWILFAVGNALALAVGAWLFYADSITVGTVYMFFYYTELLRRPLWVITDQLQDLQKAGGSIERVEELHHTRSQMPEHPTATLPHGPLSVTFDRVKFAYNETGLALDGISLQLEQGRVLGLLGRTGSGKTMLSRLVFRLYDPSEGVVRLGGVDVRDVSRADLRQRVGMVTQDVQLFSATVRDNLTFFDPSVPDDRIIQSLYDLGLAEWYERLPDGLATLVQAGGIGLSAGEAQLLAFTRVFLRDPSVVILDEASSRLDPATEGLVGRAVERLLADRTGIVIAHRLATLQRVDEILILEDGCVREYGDRVALAADSRSRFHELLHTGLEEVLA
jgi:ATP-binding cassette subfamily B protein